MPEAALIRRLSVAVLLGGAIVALPAVPAQAAPMCKADYYCTVTFYSNAAHTTVIGQRTVDCAGNNSMWGSFSGYETVTNSECSDAVVGR
ncbi:hypothetical protein GXW82_15025 [Streptacidiphilus sp. 4-A2]|nr:hypothetical protein [Streptacidiphilus sp. 4-A2]